MRILSLDGAVEYMNGRGLELLEIACFERNRGRYWCDLWPEESRSLLLAALQTARDGGVGRFTAFCPTATGRPRWWLTVVSPVREEGGRIIRLLATSRDVTQERRREERLRKALARARKAAAAEASYLAYLRQALEVLPAGLAFYDPDDRLVIWNEPYVVAGGADDGHTNLRRGMSFVDLLRADLADGRHPEAEGCEEAWIADRLAARRAAAAPREQRLSCGRWYRFEDRRLSDGGMVSVAVDITELRMREEAARQSAEALAASKAAAEAASEAKSQFLANMSHEIRTPLNGVIAVADLLCRRDLPPEDQKLAELIRSSGETLEHLLSDILDLAKVESGALVIERVSFHLGDLARGVAGLARLKADEKGLQLNLVVDPAADRVIQGDPTRLKQVMANLVSNAVKFTRTGRIDVRVRAVASRLKLEVEDTGVGFDPKEKDRLFRRFEQADGAITRQHGGSGLGLAICQQLAALMGGRLDCHSTPGRGSVFRVDLPLTLSAAVEALEPRTAVITTGAPLRVLVADDHPTNRVVVDLMLKGFEADTRCVENGREAVEAFRTQEFDLVLMDMQMPVMDGLSAVREIRAWERAHSRREPVPMIMLTANTLPEHIAAARAAGADAHLAKPITIDRLASAISQALSPVDRVSQTGSEALGSGPCPVPAVKGLRGR